MVRAEAVYLLLIEEQHPLLVEVLYLAVEGLDVVSAVLRLVAAEWRHCGSLCVRCRLNSSG
ncbi:hypothetical protein D9M71_702850 [compost metagenome]